MRILCDRGPIILHTPRRVTQRRIELAWQSSLAVAAAVPCGADCAALDAERFTAYGPGFIVASDAASVSCPSARRGSGLRDTLTSLQSALRCDLMTKHYGYGFN